MTLVSDVMSGLGTALLPVVAALLFEELTLGGLVRLLIAPWPGTRRHGAAGGVSPQGRGRVEHKNQVSTSKPDQRFVGIPESEGGK
jgi:hypothetical protein